MSGILVPTLSFDASKVCIFDCNDFGFQFLGHASKKCLRLFSAEFWKTKSCSFAVLQRDLKILAQEVRPKWTGHDGAFRLVTGSCPVWSNEISVPWQVEVIFSDETWPPGPLGPWAPEATDFPVVKIAMILTSTWIGHVPAVMSGWWVHSTSWISYVRIP